MAYKNGNRDQMTLLPQCIEEYVSKDDPVRAYDAFVDSLDFDSLGIDIYSHRVGNSSYNPKSMVKLLVYGYSYGVKSSRKLERECYHNLSFIWIMGGLKPDHKTIAEFRRNNKESLKKILKRCARVCIKLDLIEGNVLFVDGTKVRANASRSNSHDKDYYEKKLVEVDEYIETLLNNSEAIDAQEENNPSYIKMNKKFEKADRLKSKIQQVIDIFETSDKDKINITDPDCTIMKSIQGSHASYNVQSVVDDKNSLIVSMDTVGDATDVNQFSAQIDKANAVLDSPCKVASGDAGYADTEELEKIEAQGIEVIVPSQRQALHEQEKPFSKIHFVYDKQKNCYICPEGKELRCEGVDKKSGKIKYRVKDKKTCYECSHFGQCTTAKRGRSIARLKNEEAKRRFEAKYEEAESQAIYKRRKSRVEHPFGHIKRNLKTDSFLLRGKEGVLAELSLLASCFNIRRMITIFGGVVKFIEKIKGLRLKLATE